MTRAKIREKSILSLGEKCVKMPTLTNKRWELFAQSVAKGSSKAQAYLDAGYEVKNKENASSGRVGNKPQVLARVDELITRRETLERRSIEVAATKLSIDREWVLSKLVNDQKRASAARHYSASIRALELIGKELGMFVERKDVRVQFTELSDGALAEALAGYLSENDPCREGEVFRTSH